MFTSDARIAGWINGPDGVTPGMVTDAILPGRALTTDGNDIEPGTEMRAYAVANYFRETGLLSRGGLIICSADRTPAATKGDPWQDPETHQPFPNGIPEAEGFRDRLVDRSNVPAANVIKQQRSFETVGDIRRGEDTLLAAFSDAGIDPRERVVMLAAQKKHLERIMGIIAPRAMRLRYIGAIVPEVNPNQPDSYSPFASLVSRYIVRGLQPDQQDTTKIIDQRAKRAWGTVTKIRAAKSSVLSVLPGHDSQPAFRGGTVKS